MGRRRRAALLVRRPGGDWEVNLGDDERGVMARLAGDLAQVVEVQPDLPALSRLFPVAHPDEPDREQEWRLLMGEEVRTERLAQLRVLVAVAEDPVLSDADVERWLQAVNSLRLVLGSQLVETEDDRPPRDPDHPDAAAWELYEFMGMLVYEAVRALSAGRPDGTGPEPDPPVDHDDD